MSMGKKALLGVLSILLIVLGSLLAGPMAQLPQSTQADPVRQYVVQLKPGVVAWKLRRELIADGFQIRYFQDDFMVIGVRKHSRASGALSGLHFAAFMTGDARKVDGNFAIPEMVRHAFHLPIHTKGWRPSGSKVNHPEGLQSSPVVLSIERMIRDKNLDRGVRPDSTTQGSPGNEPQLYSPSATGAISGELYNKTGGAAVGVNIEIYDSEGNFVTFLFLCGPTTYSIGGLETGTYKILFDTFLPPADQYAYQWFNDEGAFHLANEVNVTDGNTTDVGRTYLENCAAISGTVTEGKTGDGISGLRTKVYDKYGTYINYDNTDGDGYYEVRGLRTGWYRVEFNTDSVPQYVSVWYNDKPDFDSADAVKGTEGSTTSDIDARLVQYGSLSGTVTDQGTNGIQNVRIMVYDLSKNQVVPYVDTDANGDYSVTGLPPGPYKINFFTILVPDYACCWYDNSRNFSTATEVVVHDGAATGGIDATLLAAGYITGTVSAVDVSSLNGVDVYAYDAEGFLIARDTTAYGGGYTIGGMDGSGFKVFFDASNLPYTYEGLVSEWYDHKADSASADTLDVYSGLTTENIDAELDYESVTVLIPDGGENWTVGSVQTITWNTWGEVDNVHIEYSTNNGTDWTDIVASTANDGSHAWTVPNTPSSQCLVRISDAADDDPTDTSDATFTISAPVGVPEISLNRSQLNFGVESGAQTQSQEVLVSNVGSGTLNWTATDDAAWLGVSPASGSGTAKLTVSVDPTGLDPGTYNGTVTVSDSAATNSPQTVAVTLRVYAADGTGAPFGSFATPVDQSTVQSSISVSGWALDDVEVVSLKIYREAGENLVYIGDAVFVEGARPDLETSYPTYPLNYRGGWGYMLCTYGLPDQGMSATYTLHAIATDKEGNTTDLGTKTITCDNQHAVKPFGAIATPAQGGEASGAAYRNWGWALTPPPNLIPTDGSTMRLLVDGAPVGYLNYNLYRADIATLFPECLNSDGAAAYYDLDTTGYANGVHTIAWIAVDNAANADGIGSRFFTIVNTSGGSAMAATVGGVQATLSADTIKDYMIDPSSMRLSRNGNDVRRGRQFHADPVSGTSSIEMKVLSAIAMDLNPDKKPGVHFTGYMQVRDELRRLPIGSTMDSENNLFYWQPAPGFYGEYDLVFVDKSRKLVKRIRVRVK